MLQNSLKITKTIEIRTVKTLKCEDLHFWYNKNQCFISSITANLSNIRIPFSNIQMHRKGNKFLISNSTLLQFPKWFWGHLQPHDALQFFSKQGVVLQLPQLLPFRIWKSCSYSSDAKTVLTLEPNSSKCKLCSHFNSAFTKFGGRNNVFLFRSAWMKIQDHNEQISIFVLHIMLYFRLEFHQN